MNRTQFQTTKRKAKKKPNSKFKEFMDALHGLRLKDKDGFKISRHEAFYEGLNPIDIINGKTKYTVQDAN